MLLLQFCIHEATDPLWNQYYNGQPYTELNKCPISYNEGSFFIKNCIFRNNNNIAINFENAQIYYHTLIIDSSFYYISSIGPCIILQEGGSCVMMRITSDHITASQKWSIAKLSTTKKFSGVSKYQILDSSFKNMNGVFEHIQFVNGLETVKSVNMSDSKKTNTVATFAYQTSTETEGTTSHFQAINCHTDGDSGVRAMQGTTRIIYSSFINCNIRGPSSSLFDSREDAKLLQCYKIIVNKCTYKVLAFEHNSTTILITDCYIVDSSNDYCIVCSIKKTESLTITPLPVPSKSPMPSRSLSRSPTRSPSKPPMPSRSLSRSPTRSPSKSRSRTPSSTPKRKTTKEINYVYQMPIKIRKIRMRIT